jgi:demethylmenaquinone methyltransferase/2-methoxy-6-polyprenyl-1,4-benzoquinol methylase
MRAYYHRRAPEYDQWYAGEGRFAAREREGWEHEMRQLERVLRDLPAARTLDVACGTGFLTRHLSGLVVGLDASPAMAAIAQRRLPRGVVVVGEALRLPFPDQSFTRVLTGHFYGHLQEAERAAFLTEARRVARELVVVDSALHDGVQSEEWQERVLNDGSRHRVYKRYFDAEELAAELGGGRVLLAGGWFVAVEVATP